MTGLPCSGKTTIARKLKEFIFNLGVLDGDDLREWFSPKDFSVEGRNEHNQKVAHLAKLLMKHNVPVCVSLISPYFENRKTAREIIGDDKFIETYVKCSLKVCEERDVKGMYKKARTKEITNFTGIDDAYDIPKHPDIILETENISVEESIKTMLNHLHSNGFLNSSG